MLNLAEPLIQSDHAVRNIAPAARSFPAKSIIMEADVQPSCLYLVQDGWAVRCRFLADGRRLILGLYLPGDFIDPLWSDGARCSGHILALTDVWLQKISFENVSHDILQEEIRRNAAIQNEWLANLAGRSTLSKMAHLLCELATRMAHLESRQMTGMRLPLTQLDVADMCGITGVHANRSLQRMRSMKLVALRRRQLQIIDFRGLANLGEFSPHYLERRRSLPFCGQSVP